MATAKLLSPRTPTVVIPPDADEKRFRARHESPDIDRFFRAVRKLNGSTLHLKVGSVPHVRVGGNLVPMNRGPLDEDEMVGLIMPIMDERAQQLFARDGGVDFAYTLQIDGKAARNRVNVFRQQGRLAMVARAISNFIPDFKSLHLPDGLEELCRYSQGMILLAGTTGCGKSTTIASMLNWINHNSEDHIVTLEDPIEFTFSEVKSLINQREIGIDVKDFMTGMKHAVREDPDVILVGEMRDQETFETALQAAETGHLVFGTVHSSSAPTTVGRILDLFPSNMHPAIRSAMVFNMRAIIAQKLLPCIRPGIQRVPAVEILAFNPSVRKLILEGEDDRLVDAMRIGIREGMRDFTYSLKELVLNRFVDRATAMEVAPNPEALKMAIKGIDSKESGML